MYDINVPLSGELINTAKTVELFGWKNPNDGLHIMENELLKTHVKLQLPGYCYNKLKEFNLHFDFNVQMCGELKNSNHSTSWVIKHINFIKTQHLNALRKNSVIAIKLFCCCY